MLVLTRKQSQMIQIGENVVIKVIKTGRNTVKIGIDAPSDVRILRSELCEQTPQVLRMGSGEAANGETTESVAPAPVPIRR